MAASITKLGAFLSFPAPPGNTNLGFTLINGPSSYTAISTATPPTGGILLNASDMGLTSITAVFPIVSDNGQYVGYAMPASGQNQPQTQVRLMICTANGGAEASGDLSAYSFAIMALGG